MPGKLLLTGATGFVGYYLAQALAADGRPFVALVREDSDTTQLTTISAWCTLVYGDLTDPGSMEEAMDGVDTVIHAAALVSMEDRREDELLQVNGTGTANLVNVMLHAGVRRLVHLGSVAALDRVDGGPLTTAADRWPENRLTTAYARSKFAAEREIWRGQAEGLSVAAVYPSTILGAGDWQGDNTPSLWTYVDNGGRLYPRGAAGFIDVRDVVRAVLTVVDRDVDRERFLLNAANLSWQDFFRQVARSLDASPPSIGLSHWQSAMLWPLAGLWSNVVGGQPVITRASHRTGQATYRYDGRPYVEATGQEYIPPELTIAEIGKAFRMSQGIGQGLPATYLPVVRAGE
ncbi:NAD-dependent epimerase/dehydratase family protein [Lewinella sp. IMCC34191]|uniref:NAD-dependent epimerase/dehydratase family protein n=1 Tax=Lewinella sp. IMCC34191 TaxID=2259172 RepID=UPI000E271FC9|nr:NAD-dependent epimerase/dehydratase family protein [Lewinella sp. IMCC34191]